MIQWVLAILAWPVYRLLYWTRVRNRRALRAFRGKPVLLCCNHKSFMDGPALFYTLRRRFNFLVKESIFEGGFMRWFVPAIGGFPVGADNGLAVTKFSLKTLKGGRALLIFPEGMRAFNPEDALPLRNGASMIAVKANVPILPIVINRKPKPFRLTRIQIGSPISVEEYQGRKVEKDELTELSNKVRDQMDAMLGKIEKKPKQKWWEKERSATARGIVFKNDEGGTKMLVMERRRPTYRDGALYYTIPGGHLEEGEGERDAVVREIDEETSVKVRPLRTLYKYKFDGDGKMHAFIACEYLGGEPSTNDIADEYQDGATERIWHDGGPRGTINPVWVNIEEMWKQDFDLKPEALKIQLEKDIKKSGTQLIKSTTLIK